MKHENDTLIRDIAKNQKHIIIYHLNIDSLTNKFIMRKEVKYIRS